MIPSLAPHLTSSRILALYFAASWCPDCTPVTPALKSLYLSQPTTEPKKLLEVLYVSSDSSKEQMDQTMTSHHGPWKSIPFDNVEERSNLKKHFGACAGKEMMEVGLGGPGQRKFGIPTIILIDCQTEAVLTTDGVDDLMRGSGSSDVLSGWEKLLSSSASS